MDYVSMIRLIFAILISIVSSFSMAGTAVLYPTFGGFGNLPRISTPITPGPLEFSLNNPTLSSNWGIKNGYFWQNPAKSSLSATANLSAADALAMNNAITGVAKASQPAIKLLAKGILGGAVVTGVMFALPWLLEKGIHYDNSIFTTQTWDGKTYEYLNNYGDHTGNFTGNRDSFCHTTFNQPFTGYSCNGIGGFALVSTSQPTYSPVTSAQIDTATINNRDLTDAELKEMVNLGFAVPTEKPVATVIGDFSAITATDLAALAEFGYFQKNPLNFNAGAPSVDPVSGEIKQPKLSFEPAPNGGVKVTSYDLPINPDGTPAKNSDGTPKPPEESKDPCAANPDSVSCSSLGSLDPAADPTPTTLNVSLTPGTLSTAGSCPAPRSLQLMGHPVVMSYQPICDAASTYVRPFVILASAVVSAFIFIGGLKS